MQQRKRSKMEFQVRKTDFDHGVFVGYPQSTPWLMLTTLSDSTDFFCPQTFSLQPIAGTWDCMSQGSLGLHCPFCLRNNCVMLFLCRGTFWDYAWAPICRTNSSQWCDLGPVLEIDSEYSVFRAYWGCSYWTWNIIGKTLLALYIGHLWLHSELS